MKLNFKNIQFKELFLEHVEKGVLAIAGLCLALFIFSAVGREKLPPDKEPDQLVAQTNNARNHVETSDPRDAMKEIESPDRIPYYTRVNRDPVLLDNYATKIPFNAPILESKTPRDEPIYFTVRELQVGTGFAPFAISDPTKARETDRPDFQRRRPDARQPEEHERMQALNDAANVRAGVNVGRDSKLVVRYWAMVTGLIPIRDQKAEYYKAFETAVNFQPEQDLPWYLGYQVERAEVASGDLDSLKWEKISADTKFMAEWGVEYREPAMPENVTPMFTQHLGPRVGSDWEDYVGHPKIPMEPRAGMHGPDGMGDMRGGGFPGGGRGAELGGGAGPFDGGEMGEVAEDEDEAIAFDRAAPRRNRVVQEEDPAEIRRRQEPVGRAGQKDIKGVDNLLFRFCDYTVQPGKQYVYRVRLGLSNPNRGLPVKYLKRPELADAKPRITPWSDPSPVATIPYGDKMLAGKVIPPATSISEPKAVFRIIQVNDELGAEVPLEKEVSRGTLANFKDSEFRYKDYVNDVVGEGTADFITNSLILDMRGGQPIFGPREKDITQPGELLVLTRTGELVAMNEFDGEDTWQAYVPPEEDEARSGGQFGPLFDGPGGAGESAKPHGRKAPTIRGGPDQPDILRGNPAPKPKRTRNR